MANEKAVAKKEDTNVPAHFKSYKGETGADTIGQQDITVPRLNIAQPLSECIEKGVKAGEFYHSTTMKSYGSNIQYYILMHWASDIWFSTDFKFIATRFINPVTKEQMIVGEIPEEEPKNAQNYMVVEKSELKAAVLEKRPPEIMIFSPKSAMCKYARQLNTELKHSAGRGIPIWGKVVAAKTEIQIFTEGKAYMPHFETGAFIDEKGIPVMERLVELAKGLQGKDSVHQEGSTEGDGFDQ